MRHYPGDGAALAAWGEIMRAGCDVPELIGGEKLSARRYSVVSRAGNRARRRREDALARKAAR